MEIRRIKTKNELVKVILYLQNYFNWSNQKAFKIKNNLILNNKSLGIYGYILLNKKEVLNGAFLLLDQSFINNDKKLKFINMFSWYVSSEARGIDSLLMIRALVKDYPEYIITNVSSNLKAYKILKALGFQDSNIYNRKFNFLSFIFNLNLFDIRNISFIFKLNNNFFKMGSNKVDLNNPTIQEFNIGNKKLEVITSMTIIQKKIGLFNLKFKGLRILWTSDPVLFSKYFYKLSLFYIIKNFLFFITCHCQLKKTHNLPASITKQIFYSSDNKYKNNNIALGSELNFI